MWRKFQHAWGVLRRFWLVHFRPDYVQRQLQKRQGECRRCGNCCLLVCRCPFLKGENQCTIYGWRSRQCREFPIDERDLKDVPSCGFRFEEVEEAVETLERSKRAGAKQPGGERVPTGNIEG